MCASTNRRKMIPVTAMTIFIATVVRRPGSCRAAVVVVDTPFIVATPEQWSGPTARSTVAPAAAAGAFSAVRPPAWPLGCGHVIASHRGLPRRGPRRRGRDPAVAVVPARPPEVPARPHRRGRQPAAGDLGPAGPAHRAGRRARRHRGGTRPGGGRTAARPAGREPADRTLRAGLDGGHRAGGRSPARAAR